ncbi:MAG: hypothetical protein HC802_10770 [Caldilineaceae bacterium]|nr:hypothetical protein [Caldilineaceae bacterium]
MPSMAELSNFSRQPILPAHSQSGILVFTIKQRFYPIGCRLVFCAGATPEAQ